MPEPIPEPTPGPTPEPMPEPTPEPMREPAADLHLVRRAQVARAVKIGKAVGYGCFALACVAFGFIWLDKPTDAANAVIAWSMGVGSLFLAPAIVFGYAVAKAEREEKADDAARAARVAKRNAQPPSQ